MGAAGDNDVRLLTDPELGAAWELTRLTFGAQRDPPPGWLAPRPGRRPWGLFDRSGRLLAKATDREQGHWFGGRLVPASGIAGVVVVPELRGTGLGRRLLTAVLAAARARGAVIATLFRTTPEPYRRLGWEEVGALTWTALPAAALGSLRQPAQVTLRPAEPDDVPEVLEVYRVVARAGAGLMERSGPLFDTSTEAVLAGHDGITVAVGADGVLEGFASWDRGPGYDAGARLTVPDLIGLTEPATTALLAMLGTWASVTPTLALRLPEPDPAGWLAPMTGARIESTDRWMLRLVDARGAVVARGWPAHLHGEVSLFLEDDVCPWNAGPHRLTLAGGAARLEPGGPGDLRVTARGLALLYAGAAGPVLLRRAGLLNGGAPADDDLLRAATAGPAPALLDYF